jgi:hypothetical protein
MYFLAHKGERLWQKEPGHLIKMAAAMTLYEICNNPEEASTARK